MFYFLNSAIGLVFILKLSTNLIYGNLLKGAGAWFVMGNAKACKRQGGVAATSLVMFLLILLGDQRAQR
jgi:hypothetical protein